MHNPKLPNMQTVLLPTVGLHLVYGSVCYISLDSFLFIPTSNSFPINTGLLHVHLLA